MAGIDDDTAARGKASDANLQFTARITGRMIGGSSPCKRSPAAVCQGVGRSGKRSRIAMRRSLLSSHLELARGALTLV
jgi:hypothetical protein